MFYLQTRLKMVVTNSLNLLLIPSPHINHSLINIMDNCIQGWHLVLFLCNLRLWLFLDILTVFTGFWIIGSFIILRKRRWLQFFYHIFWKWLSCLYGHGCRCLIQFTFDGLSLKFGFLNLNFYIGFTTFLDSWIFFWYRLLNF